ncbi:hypothetical protein [Streptomyces sp. NBC_00268]|uniref:hypothetical protein n=1 Tax=Streptomyces sp. NBC_00268 TaxID=2975695 RepID=UPI00224DC382|nr:hypothetical protein [Streptomyces sp. NBC_00268]MCX5191641.1 hypothetical protein [Streptomyces sp. NBC_00268]
MPEKPVVFGVLDGGEPFSQPALTEQDLTIDAWQEAAGHAAASTAVRSAAAPDAPSD